MKMAANGPKFHQIFMKTGKKNAILGAKSTQIPTSFRLIWVKTGVKKRFI